MREIITNSLFPLVYKRNHKGLNNVSILSIGGNIGNPISTLSDLIKKLKNNNKIDFISTSPLYINPPFGYKTQNIFYNATVILSTNMCLLELYRLIFYLERILGRQRKREFRNAPRKIDIDILFFNDLYIRSKKINIPHLHWESRDSVLVPLLFQVNYKGL